MYIAPDTTIKVLKDVPLDTTYDHTIWFENENDQANFFDSHKKYVFNNQMYQRVRRGYMRVERRAEDLYDCNYLMFQNTAFGSKWFYAFITSVEYINNNVSEIRFELDVMQTWYFDYTLQECFVEREHSVGDALFENLVDENLDLGDGFVCNQIQTDMTVSNPERELAVCVLVSQLRTDDDNWAKPLGRTINNVYTPIFGRSGFSTKDITDVDNFVNDYVDAGKEDAIVNIYEYPKWITDETDPSHSEYAQHTVTIQVNNSKLGWYTPRNKKLFCYPFNWLQMSDNSGKVAEFHWEDFAIRDTAGGIQDVNFSEIGIYMPAPCLFMYPKNYKGITDAYDYGLTYTNFPQCPWIGDAFQAYYAQHKSAEATAVFASGMRADGAIIPSFYGGIPGQAGLPGASSPGPSTPQYATGTGAAGLVATGATVGGTIGGPAGAAVGAALGYGASIAVDVGRIMAVHKDVARIPPTVHGQVNTDSLNAGMGRCGFTFYSMSIRPAQAEILDSYFDRFGYAAKTTKVPNTHVRENWTYTKTIGCTITGSIPADDANTICRIYDHGITFWANGYQVGNYSLSNKPFVVG